MEKKNREQKEKQENKGKKGKKNVVEKQENINCTNALCIQKMDDLKHELIIFCLLI